MTIGRAYGQLHLAIVLFGGIGLFAKLVDLPPGPLVFARAAVAAVTVAGAVVITGQSFAIRRRADALALVPLGAIMALHWLAFFRSIQVSTVSVAVLSLATFPVFTAVGAAALARRWPRGREVAVALLALAGVALIVGQPGGGDTTLGVLWGMGAAALFAVLTIANERLVVGYPGQVVGFYQYGLAAVALAPFHATALVGLSVGSWLALLLLGSVFTGAAHTLFIVAMRSVPSSTASLSVSLEPVYGVALAWVVLSERPSVRTLAGGAVILLAVVIGTIATNRRVVVSPGRGAAAAPG